MTINDRKGSLIRVKGESDQYRLIFGQVRWKQQPCGCCFRLIFSGLLLVYRIASGIRVPTRFSSITVPMYIYHIQRHSNSSYVTVKNPHIVLVKEPTQSASQDQLSAEHSNIRNPRCLLYHLREIYCHFKFPNFLICLASTRELDQLLFMLFVYNTPLTYHVLTDSTT